MKLLLQPNRWSCLPTSFAMGMNTELSTVIAMIGHDGADIVFPKLPEPDCRRSFHIQELIDVSWRLGYCVTPFEPQPIADHGNKHRDIEFSVGNTARMLGMLTRHSGVLTGLSKQGTHHAVAWNRLEERVYNPNGQVESLGSFSIQCFWVITKR